jgi:hypothetical protein
MVDRLASSTMVIYADLLDLCRGEVGGATAPRGAFTSKVLRGRRYWYRQFTDSGGRRRQEYLGPETPEILEAMKVQRDTLRDRERRREMVRSLRAAGVPSPDPLTGKVMSALAEGGFFERGGVLVGSRAFGLYSGMLGARLAGAAIATMDLDVAPGNLDIAAPGPGDARPTAEATNTAPDDGAISFVDLLRRADPRFTAAPTLDRGSRAWRFVIPGDRVATVELLAPMIGPEDSRLVALATQGAGAKPLRFLDYLVESPVDAVVPFGDGIAVKVPQPARYAIHKLIVSRRRAGIDASKVRKDIDQAAALLRVLVADRPAEIEDAWEALERRPPKWAALASEGMALLPEDPRTAVRRLIDVRSPSPAPSAGDATPLAVQGQQVRYDVPGTIERDAAAHLLSGMPVDGLRDLFGRTKAAVDKEAPGTDRRDVFQNGIWAIEDAARAREIDIRALEKSPAAPASSRTRARPRGRERDAGR